MKNNKFVICLLFVLFLFSVLITCSYLNLRRTIKSTSVNHNSVLNINALYEQIYADMNSDNVMIDSDIEVMSFDKSRTMLKDIISPDSMYLILKYPGTYCDDCIEKIYERIKILKDIMGEIHVFVLYQGSSLREMRIKLHDVDNSIPVYLLKTGTLGLPLDGSNLPYLTFVDDGKISKHTLIANPNQLDLLSGYLQTLADKYCEKEETAEEIIENEHETSTKIILQ